MRATALRVDYLQQFGVLSGGFIPPRYALPAGWVPRFEPFNFIGIPTWGAARQSSQPPRDFLITTINMLYNTSFPGGGIVSSVTVDTPGAGQTAGVYVVALGAPGTGGAVLQITVNADGTVHADGVVVLSPGIGYLVAPAVVMPAGAGGAPPATFTAIITHSGLSDFAGVPTLTIYHNHHRTQLQMMQKPGIYINQWGTGSRPYYLAEPYLVQGGDQLTVECSYTSALPPYAGASNTLPNYLYCYLTLIGAEPPA